MALGIIHYEDFSYSESVKYGSEGVDMFKRQSSSLDSCEEVFEKS